MATEGHFDQTFDVNVKGTFFTVQKALPLFKDGGSIILNSSVSNVMGLPGFTVYAASKAAVRNFARGWTMELKDRKIRVNSMSPGAIDTPALRRRRALPLNRSSRSPSMHRRFPLGRRGKPEEIAAAVVFLASDESSYITGVDLAVDGGMARSDATPKKKHKHEHYQHEQIEWKDRRDHRRRYRHRPCRGQSASSRKALSSSSSAAGRTRSMPL